VIDEACGGGGRGKLAAHVPLVVCF
jgi:hypothetical protein